MDCANYLSISLFLSTNIIYPNSTLRKGKQLEETVFIMNSKFQMNQIKQNYIKILN